MKYNYTAYARNEEERIKIVTDDILSEYPNLGDLAQDAAKMELPFGRAHEDYDGFIQFEQQILRLINILNVTENKPEYIKEYKKALEDINRAYENWKYGFTYANPEKQTVSILMQQLKEHFTNPEIPFPTAKEIMTRQKKAYEDEQNRLQDINNHTMKYNYTAYAKSEEERIKIVTDDILSEYPNLGDLAQEAAKMELPFGRAHEDYDGFIQFEQQILRLINILNVTENKPEYIKEYKKALEDINRAYENWKYGFTYANPEKQTVSILMQQLKEHFTNPEIPFPIFHNTNQIKGKEF